jgi:hypothetical protein
MNVLRGLLFDNLGLKLVALLLALLVYLNVYTDRPASMILTFPIQLSDLPDSLSLLGPAPANVQAEIRGTGKQLIRLRVTEPAVRLSLAGVNVGRFERAVTAADLPLPTDLGLQVERLVTPRTIELQVDRRARRALPVAATVEGLPAGGVAWSGVTLLDPSVVVVEGPAGALATLDTVRLASVSVAGRRDTVRASLGPAALPEWCVMDPPRVSAVVPLEPELTRRIVVEVEAPRGGEGFRVSPARTTLSISAPRSLLGAGALRDVRVHWTAPPPLAAAVGGKVALHRVGDLPAGVRVRMDPDSVTLLR